MKSLKIFFISFFISLSFYGFAQGTDLKTAFIELDRKVRPSVVNISIIKKEEKNLIQFMPGFYVPQIVPRMSGSGSGFIIDKKGLIVTNAHVVLHSDEIKVQFEGDEILYPAKILGKDTLSDIALLKVNVKKKLVPVAFGDSQKLQKGEWVAAIGNPHGYGHTITKGIISGVKREIDELNLFPLLQTDASINQGNSGGPLVNLKGEVVGVNNAIAVGATGISFAIPINNVKQVLKDLISHGYVRRGFIGVQFRPTPGQQGSFITNVVPGGPADKAGIQAGDIIIKFNNVEIKKPNDLPKAVHKAAVEKKSSLTFLRNGKKKKISITPNTVKEDSFTFGQKPSKANIQGGLRIPGGFRVVNPRPDILKLFGLPDMGIKHPLVVNVKPSSPAGRAGLKIGDFIFKVNEKRVSSGKELKFNTQSKVNKIQILRYHRSYDQYLAFTLKLIL